MTTTSTPVAVQRSDVITMPTLDDRAIALRRMAEEKILDDAHPGSRELGCCLELLVRSLASDAVADTVMTRFAALVEAVREQQGFTSDPRGYAVDHELPVGDRSLDSIDDSLTGGVDAALWDLLHPVPSCRTCRRTRQRLSWSPAEWPASSDCAEHRAAVS